MRRLRRLALRVSKGSGRLRPSFFIYFKAKMRGLRPRRLRARGGYAPRFTRKCMTAFFGIQKGLPALFFPSRFFGFCGDSAQNSNMEGGVFGAGRQIQDRPSLLGLPKREPWR